MKAAVMLLSLAIWAACGRCGAQCVGAETALQSAARALGSEDAARAEQILDALEPSHPTCDEIILDRGRALELKDDAPGAAASLSRYTQMEPDDARGYAYLAQVMLSQRQYPRADQASLLAIEKNPVEPAALAIRGQILAMKGQSNEGARLLEQACELDPEDAEAQFQLGTLYVRANRRGDAVKHFEKAVSLVPGNARAWDYLALNLEQIGEAGRADEAYRNGEAVNHQGRHFDGFLDYNYGRFLAKRNQLQEAKQRLDSAVTFAPAVRAVWYERAKVYLLLKDYQNARTDGEKAASLSDQGGYILDLQIYTLLEQIYRRLGENELADKYADLSRRTAVPMKESR